MNMLRRLWPTSWTADIDYDPHENIDFDFADKGPWNEADHPRDPDGKFTIAGGGAGAAPALTKYAGPAGAKMAQKLDDLIQNGGNPYKLGKEIVAEASKFKSSNVAGYMNQLLKHMELHYGAPMGTFGKAVKQKGDVESPLVEAEPPDKTEAEIDKWSQAVEQNLAALPESKPSGAIHPAQEQMTKVLQSTWPDDEKKSWIEALKAELPEDDTEGHAFAQGHLEKLGGQPAPSPAAAPAVAPTHPDGKLGEEFSQAEYDAYTKAIPMPNGPQAEQEMWEVAAAPHLTKKNKLTQLEADIANTPSQSSKMYGKQLQEFISGGEITEPEPTIPTPPTGHNLQMTMYGYATMQSLTTEEKVAKLNELTSKASAGNNKEYGKKLIEALGGTVTAAPEPEKPTPPPPLPDPKPGSNTQQSMYVIAADNPGVGGKTNTEKIAAITEALANSSGSSGGAAETYANELITALGGQPVNVDALKAAKLAPAPTTQTPTTAQSLAKKPTGVHQTPNQQKLARGQKLHKNAIKVTAASDPDAVKAAKTLDRNWWKKIDSDSRDACIEYKGGSNSINSGLREADQAGHTVNPHIQKQIDLIDDLFEHDDAVLQEDMVVWRGQDEYPPGMINKTIAALSAGKVVRPSLEGFMSTAAASKPPGGWSGNKIQYQIVARKGVRALGLWAADSGFNSENEVILRHGQPIEVYEIEHKPKTNQYIFKCYTVV